MTENLDILKLIRDNPKPENELADYPENYPYFDKQAEVTITFISPILTGDYVYKMIYPAIALNEYSKTHRAFMVGIQDFIVSQKIDDYKATIPETFIQVSNYIVLPFFTYDLRDGIEQVKAVNKDVKIVYCIDLNFLRIPTGYPNYKDYEARAIKDTIIENMRASDVVLISQTALGEFLFTELKERLSGAPVIIEVMPCGFFPELTEPIIRNENLPEVDHSKFRALLISNPTHIEDINCIREQLIAVKEKYKDKFELISFGWKGIVDFGKGLRDTFRGIPFTYQRPVNFYEYNKKLAELQPDCLLLPVKLTEDNSFTATSKNYRKFIEASAMAIPCLITSTTPYKNSLYVGDGEKLINPNVNAVMIEKKVDWVTELSSAIEDKDAKTKLDEISERAYQVAHSRFTYEKIVDWIEKIFV
jgi:hypothetical protein